MSMITIDTKDYHKSIKQIQYDYFVRDVVIDVRKGSQCVYLDRNQVVEIAKAIGITSEDL